MRLVRGDIWLVDFEPVRPGELGKRRPCVVVSDDRYNQLAPAPLVMPLTSQAPTVRSPAVPATQQTGLAQQSSILPLHIRAAARSRFLHRIGRAPSAIIEQATEILVLIIQR